jgi:hypothetical protein
MAVLNNNMPDLPKKGKRGNVTKYYGKIVAQTENSMLKKLLGVPGTSKAILYAYEHYDLKYNIYGFISEVIKACKNPTK